MTSTVSVDDGLGDANLVALAYSLRDLRPEHIDFFTAPVLGTGMEGPASVVYLDTVSCRRMWTYLTRTRSARTRRSWGGSRFPTSPVDRTRLDQAFGRAPRQLLGQPERVRVDGSTQRPGGPASRQETQPGEDDGGRGGADREGVPGADGVGDRGNQ